MKKFISLLTILSMILMTTGCYSRRIIVNPEIIKSTDYSEFKSVKLHTTDSREVTLTDAKIEDDSFTGIDKNEKVQTKIKTADVAKVTCTKYHKTATIISIVLGALVVVGGIVTIAVLHNIFSSMHEVP